MSLPASLLVRVRTFAECTIERWKRSPTTPIDRTLSIACNSIDYVVDRNVEGGGYQLVKSAKFLLPLQTACVNDPSVLHATIEKRIVLAVQHIESYPSKVHPEGGVNHSTILISL